MEEDVKNMNKEEAMKVIKENQEKLLQTGAKRGRVQGQCPWWGLGQSPKQGMGRQPHAHQRKSSLRAGRAAACD